MAKRNTPENDLTNALIDLLHGHSYTVKKIYNGAIASRCVNGRLMYRKKPEEYKGIPDLLVYSLVYKRFMFIEVKTPKGRVKPEQKEFMESVNACGTESYVVRSLETLKEILHDQDTTEDQRLHCASCR